MITVMKTKTFLNALDDAYAKGVSAGANAQKVAGHDDAYTDGYAAGVSAQKLSDHEDQNRRLEEHVILISLNNAGDVVAVHEISHGTRGNVSVRQADGQGRSLCRSWRDHIG